MTRQARFLVLPPARRRRLGACRRLALGLAVLWGEHAWSAETFVVSGSGTLAAAIAAASPGDTLILQNGTYSGSATVDKSLTIRPLNASTVAMVSGGTLSINASGGSVLIQGLGLSSSLSSSGATDLKVLENDFYGAGITAYYGTHVAIIGNRFHTSGSISVSGSSNDEAYVAGNTLDNGQIQLASPGWIVGNSVNSNSASSPLYATASGTVQLIGNRVSCNLNYMTAITIGTTSGALVAGNIVTVSGSSSPSVYKRGIESPSSVYARVINNVINYATGSSTPSSIGISAFGQVQGNIVLNMASGTPIAGSSAQYNLCYGGANGACGANPLTIDPLFIDTIDYKLAAGSPAIDAGPDDPFVADLDRTRNDLGAYGGPWSIGQYDAQRDPSYTGPYVYPLFEANSSLLDPTTLQVRALGVARFR